jgi:hypothetical protein
MFSSLGSRCTEVRTAISARFELRLWLIESPQGQGHEARRSNTNGAPKGVHHRAGGGRFSLEPERISVAAQALPNPSLERTSTGKAPWPRGFHAYHPPCGQATSPVVSAQLKR